MLGVVERFGAVWEGAWELLDDLVYFVEVLEEFAF